MPSDDKPTTTTPTPPPITPPQLPTTQAHYQEMYQLLQAPEVADVFADTSLNAVLDGTGEHAHERGNARGKRMHEAVKASAALRALVSNGKLVRAIARWGSETVE